ncbi:MAG: peptidylprolyl isomerase [Clostridiales bacterium]|jgi:peptidyl-prolyl cis-trans isomerase B (cyclophilin B)|nr:peptidylprolyl isomerase [Clostridiales bacterium]
MLWNIRDGSKSGALLKFFCGCISAALLFSVSCSSADPSKDVSEPAAETISSEEAPLTPEASLTTGPSPTPEIVDLSQYQELPLPQLEPIADGEEIALMHTSMGTIHLRFFPDYAPKAVQNFKTLAKSGYYDGVLFNHVIENSMIYSGDPGDGTGGQSIWGQSFSPEASPYLHHIRGAVSMVIDENTYGQGSQFFIVVNSKLSDEVKTEIESYRDKQNQVVAETTDGAKVPMAQIFPEKIIDAYLEGGGIPGLDMTYGVFGQIFDGLDIAGNIASVPTSQEEDTKDEPLTDVVIEKIEFEQYKA